MKPLPSFVREMSHIAPAAIAPYVVEVFGQPRLIPSSHGMRSSVPSSYAIDRLVKNLGAPRKLSSVPTNVKTRHPSFVSKNDNPFDPYRFFEDDFFHNDFFRSPFGMTSPRQHAFRNMNYEVTEDDKLFKLHIDVPGVKASDIKVEIVPNRRLLKLSGERKSVSEGARESSSFMKSFVLDKTVDLENVTAGLKDGVMTISARKLENVGQNAIQIPVSVESTAGIDAESGEILQEEENENEILEATGQKEHAA
jgi:HSP20 family protein